MIKFKLILIFFYLLFQRHMQVWQDHLILENGISKKT